MEMSDSDTLRAVANWLAGNHPAIMMNESDELYRIADTIDRKAPSDELPNDKSIHAEAENEYVDFSSERISRINGFIRGAKWMRDKMQGK